MASRPVFVADNNSYVRAIETEFEYFNGFSKVQKQKCSESLHAAYLKSHPDAKLLEVSSFSKSGLGNDLSAFNMLISLENGRKVPLEVAFQAGKVFEYGGPYKDLLDASPKKAKTDPRLSESGRIISFDFEGVSFSNEPVTLFYTWLYLHALNENQGLADQLYNYDAFTDIVFNPNKSINCQAYACAVYVSLRRKDEIDKALHEIEFISNVLRKTLPVKNLTDNYGIPAKNEVKERINMPAKSNHEKLSISLKERDVILHPKYGEGIINKIEVGSSGTRLLYVSFNGIKDAKKLSEKWVITNCNCPTVSSCEMYEKITDSSDLNDSTGFYYYQSKDHPFTEQMKKSIKLSEQCFDRRLSFAVLGDNVIMVIFPGESLDINEIKNNVQNKCDDILGNHPDFETVTVEDRLFLVVMSNNMICIVPNKEKENELSIGNAIIHRQEILDACDERTIYGIVVGKDFGGELLQ